MKSLFKFSSLVAMAAAVSLAAAGCGGDSSQSQSESSQAASTAEPIVLKLGHIQSEQDLWQLGSLKFKEEVERLSNGTMRVDIFPNSTLGGDRDLAEGMKIGTVDFALIAGVLGNFDMSIGILELPYLFRNGEEYKKIVEGPIGQEIAGNVLKNAGIRIFNFWDRGPRHVTANKPILTPDDIKGLKIRVAEIPAIVATWKAMGATPTPMAWSEVYTGLQQHTIDAQENPIPFIYGGRIQEVQTHISLTAHKYEYVTISMSEKKYQQLTKEQQDIIAEAANIATEYENGLVLTETERLLNEMVEKNGLIVNYPDIEPFAELAIPAHEPYAKSIGMEELLYRINRELGR